MVKAKKIINKPEMEKTKTKKKLVTFVVQKYQTRYNLEIINFMSMIKSMTREEYSRFYQESRKWMRGF